jgi:hypothetical protein
MDGMNWRKASYSGNGEACVEVATADAVLIRDTKGCGRGPVLRVSPEAWSAFMRKIKAEN